MTQAKTVLVRYIGQRNLLGSTEDVKATQEAINAGLLSRETAYAANARRRMAMPYVSVRILGPSEGLSDTYVWGKAPESFVQEVKASDWDKMQKLAEAGDFVTMDGTIEDARQTLRDELLNGRWRG